MTEPSEQRCWRSGWMLLPYAGRENRNGVGWLDRSRLGRCEALRFMALVPVEQLREDFKVSKPFSLSIRKLKMNK